MVVFSQAEYNGKWKKIISIIWTNTIQFIILFCGLNLPDPCLYIEHNLLVFFFFFSACQFTLHVTMRFTWMSWVHFNKCKAYRYENWHISAPLLLSREDFFFWIYADNYFICLVLGLHRYVYIVKIISRFNKCIKNWHIREMDGPDTPNPANLATSRASVIQFDFWHDPSCLVAGAV